MHDRRLQFSKYLLIFATRVSTLFGERNARRGGVINVAVCHKKYIWRDM